LTARRATAPGNLDAERITATVLSQINAPSPRTGQLAASLVSHVHDFIRENQVTRDEWMAGLDFLARTGHWTSETRNEFILMSDTSGCSTLVDALNNAGPANMTPTTVEGPFHSPAPARQMGDVIATGEQWALGDWTLMHGRVLDPDGNPVAGARIDIWQADQAGLYDVQDERMHPGDLRGLLTTGADGRYWFRTVKPCSYPVPTDGPGGEWLRATGRQPMRPAHIHARVDAAGYRPLITHLFVAGDPYLDVDAAFGVRDGLTIDFPVQDDAAQAEANGMPGPYFDVSYDLVLVPAGWSAADAAQSAEARDETTGTTETP
jgi:catechol 1,2-dioxygenase